MGETLIRDIIIASILFCFIAAGASAIYARINSDSPALIDNDKYTQFNNSFNKLDDIQSTVNDLNSSLVADLSESKGTFGVLNALIDTTWNTLSLIGNSLTFMWAIIHNLNTFLGVPTWVGSIVVSLILVVIVFTIFSAIFQRDV